jgi:AraC family transcriptional regulator, alkane utilization regulator
MGKISSAVGVSRSNMDRLNEPRGGRDPVSEVLRAVRVRSTVYCRSVMSAPWGFGVEAHGSPAFHVVIRGSCWLEADGESRQIALASGDLVVLPSGRRHWLRDDPATPARELDEILTTTPPDERRRLRYGGSGPRTEVLCGGFALEGAGANPVLGALPAVIHIRGIAGGPAPWVGATIALLAAQADSDAPGAEAVVSRLADALLIQALRVPLAETDTDRGVPVLGLRDTQIAAAIELIHREPRHAWTVGELSARSGLSRSAFAARFRALVGESPKRYVTRYRLNQAATLLHTTDLGLAGIARLAGYETEFSFNRAFKRAFGLAPGAYRGQPEDSTPDIEVVAEGQQT